MTMRDKHRGTEFPYGLTYGCLLFCKIKDSCGMAVVPWNEAAAKWKSAWVQRDDDD